LVIVGLGLRAALALVVEALAGVVALGARLLEVLLELRDARVVLRRRIVLLRGGGGGAVALRLGEPARQQLDLLAQERDLGLQAVAARPRERERVGRWRADRIDRDAGRGERHRDAGRDRELGERRVE